MNTITCRACEKPFLAKRSNAIYCSRHCQYIKTKVAPHTCNHCQREFVPYRRGTKFCSQKCNRAAGMLIPERVEKLRERERKWRHANRDKIRERQSDARYKARKSLMSQLHYASNCEEIRLKHQGNYYALRLAAITAYGAKCACCGESQWKFLTIDHINGDGARHRKEIGTGAAVFRWLRRMEYPEGFQVLCFNCNCAKWTHGVCPHQKVTEEIVDSA